ncbi:pentatricopeptide repeat-containing protein At4g18975, chloroplastic-like isoform X2 [Cryptomeria japonica]|uniref:pentatricopeptide repeat-containing protein At4g18975, chloroplastic-like isoform X2 n=1 Tax=Cryptomeria japonica TaxID=3369 RepID=UPI0025ACFCBF|nr:pentatricopeptide repeat-containing protein At4g18975, chloroplastic-like isoform X2 [Cryptomeria japonica]
MLSKGQCMTMNTYEQLIRALEKDHRAEEAHVFWEARIGSNLHSVPWQLCTYMISMYQRNNMPERLIKLFNDLELHNRKPPYKTIIKMVADAFELLGLKEEQQRVLEKYCSLFKKSSNNRSKKKKEKMVQDCNGENADRLSGVHSPGESELLIEKILSNGDAGSNPNGSMEVSTAL